MPSMSPARRSARRHHRVLIVGGGTAGITVAARLRRAGVTDVAVLEPARSPTGTSPCGPWSAAARPRSTSPAAPKPP
ncbi:FAD-dependent oxidoreductase [Streptomyces sp. GLT-R25]